MSVRAAGVVVVLLCAAVCAAAEPPQPYFRPVLLAPDLPDVAECHDVLTQEILNLVSAAAVDPGRAFEQWRREHRNMMEASPVIECESKLWMALRRKSGLFNTATVPADADHLGLEPPDRLAQQKFHAFAASIGSNVDPAGGVLKYQGEVQLAFNPNNTQQLVAGANTFYRDPDAGCQSPKGGSSKTFGTQDLYGSSDGGATWIRRCAPWPSVINGGLGGASAYFGSDPAVAWDNSGRAYAVYMLISQTNSGSSGASIVIVRSTDVGATWTYLGTIVDNIASSSLFDDKEFIAIDQSPGPASTLSHPGRIYVVWDENNVERVAYSDDGAAWTTVVLPTPSFGQYDIGGDVKVGPDGTVYVIWNRLVYSGNTQSSEGTVFSKSVNGGVTWSTPVTVATHALLSFGTNNTPPAQETRGVNAFGSLSLDTNSASAYSGRVYVAYPDFPTGTTSGTNTNIYVARSTNGGTSWSSPVKVNDDSGTATQFFPWAAVDPTDGSLNVAWYDTRVDTTNNRQAQFFYARSIDGGASFEPNLLVTDNGGTVWNNSVSYSDENTTDNASRNGNQYGDYSGLVAVNRKVLPLWTDSREFFPTFPVGDDRREDMAVATIINCSAPASIATPTVSVGASCSTPTVVVTWNATSGWGTNATGGTYSVYRSTTSTFPGGSPIASGLVTTNYSDTSGTGGTTYYYFVTMTNNCPGTALTPMSTNTSASASIVFPVAGAAPTATVSGDATICAGSSTTISAALTGTGPWSVSWSDGAIQTGVAVSPATRLVSPSVNTTYLVTAVSDANCTGSAGGSAAITVNAVPATPTINAGGPTTFCTGGSVTLTSSSGSGNQWSRNGTPIGGATNTTFNATLAGSYTVTVTAGNGCTATSAATVVTVNAIPATPSITPSGSTTACNGGTVGLTSSAASGNQWLLNGGAISGATNSTYSATATGSYSVQVTVNGCSATSAPLQINISSAITVNPSTIPSGVMNTAYNATFSTTGGSGSTTFAETGTLPAGMTFSGNTLSGTPTEAGASFPITITATDANGCTGSRAYTLVVALPAGSTPTALIATATATNSVGLIWTPVASTNHYEVTRSSLGGAPATIASPTLNSLTDTLSLSPSTTYVYRVRAVDNAANASAYSTPDIATTILFTDDPVGSTTLVKGTHLTELRTAVNAVRAAGGLSAATFTDASLSGVAIKATHILELRTALNAGRSAIGVPAIGYAYTITGGSSLVHAIDVTELRSGVK